MKADFQMTELKLKYAKWQYDVNKGNKGPVKPQQRDPGLSWSSESTSLPNIAENMAARRRGEGSPTVAQQMSLASFGSDGRIRDTSGHDLVAHQRLLSSYGARDQHVLSMPTYPNQVQMSNRVHQGQMSSKVHQGQRSDVHAKMIQHHGARTPYGQQDQSTASTVLRHTFIRPPGQQIQRSVRVNQGQMSNDPSVMSRSHVAPDSNGHNGQVIHSERTEQSSPSPRPQTNALGLEQLELRLRNMNQPAKQERAPPQRAPPQRTLIAPLKPYTHNQEEPQRTGGSSGMDPHQSSNRYGYKQSTDHQPISYQDRDNRERVQQRVEPHHRNQQHLDQQQRGQREMSHRGMNIQHWDQQHLNNRNRDQQHLDLHHRDQQYLDHANRNIQYRDPQQGNHYQRDQQRMSHQKMDQQNLDHQQRANQQRSHQHIDNQHRNTQPREMQQRDVHLSGHQHNVGRAGTSNIPRLRTHHGPSSRTVHQDDVLARTNRDLDHLKEERNRLLKDFGNILLEPQVRKQNEVKAEIHPGVASEGFDYDGDSWEMETSESSVETYDVGTQYPCPGEKGYSESFESIESCRYKIEGSDETFQSSGCTYDVCIQVSVQKINKTLPQRLQSSTSVPNEKETLVGLVHSAPDNTKLKVQVPSTSSLPKQKHNGQTSSDNDVEDILLVVSLPKDNAQHRNVDVDRDSLVQNVAQDIEDLDPLVIAEPQEISTELSLGIEEELVPYLICPQKKKKKSRSSGSRQGDVLQKLSQEMRPSKLPIKVQQKKGFLEADNEDQLLIKSRIDSRKIVVEESVLHIKGAREQGKLNSAHRDDMLEQLAHDNKDSDTPLNNEHEGKSTLMLSRVDENETAKRERKIVVEEFVPRMKASHNETQFSARGVHRDNALDSLVEELKHDKDAETAAESNRTVLHFDENLHVSVDVIKSERAEPNGQSVDLSTLGKLQKKTQDDKVETVVEDNIQIRSVPNHHEESNSRDKEDDLERIMRELNSMNTIVNEVPDGDHSSPLREHIPGEDDKEQSEVRCETPVDQGSPGRLCETGKDLADNGVEETIQSHNLPQSDVNFNTNSQERDIAVGNLTKEMEQSSDLDIEPEVNSKELKDERIPVSDNFNEVLVCDTKHAVELSNLTSAFNETNESQCDTRGAADCRLVGAPSLSPSSPNSSPDIEDNEEESYLSNTNDDPKHVRGIEDSRLIGNRDSTHEMSSQHEDGEDKPQSMPHDFELSDSFDITTEIDLPSDSELAADEPSEDEPGLRLDDDIGSRDDLDLVSTGIEINSHESPRRSKIPVFKSKFPRSTSCPIHGNTEKETFKQNPETPKFHGNAGDRSSKHHPVTDASLGDETMATSPELPNSFAHRSEKSRLSLRGDKERRSRIPVASNFKRTGSLPIRPRTAMGLYSAPTSRNQRPVVGASPRVTDSKPNGKTYSKNIDTNDEESVTSSTEQSPRQVESGNVVNDKESLSLSPSETDDFIKTAKDILLRISAAQSHVSETHPESLNLHLSDGDTNEGPGGSETSDSLTPSPGRDLDFLALEAQIRDEDACSETCTLHSENDLEIRSPLYDEVFRLDQEAKQKYSNSRIPVLKGSHKPVPKQRRKSGSTDTEDEVTNESSSKERSIARISPMPREVEDDLIEIPVLQKPTESRVPIISPIPIKQTPKGNRIRSYSEADGDIEMTFDQPDKIPAKEYDDEDDVVEDHHSDSEQIITPKRTQSSREVRPRGSYWAFSTSPRLASTEFERSQTRRLNRPKVSGGRSPARTPRGTPRTTPGGTPKATPKATPRVTPKGTPKATPRATPRVSPKVTPRGTPRETPTPIHVPKDLSPRDGTLGRHQQHPKTPPTFKSRECAFVPLPEWNRLKEVLASGEQAKKGGAGPTTLSDYSYSSRRSSDASSVKSPTTPKPSRYRVDGRVPAHLKKKYSHSSSMSNVSDDKEFYPYEQDQIPRGAAAQETDSPWVVKSSMRKSLSSQSVPYDDIPYGVKVRKADIFGDRKPTPDGTGTQGRSPTAAGATTDRPRAPSASEATSDRRQSPTSSEALGNRGRSPTASEATADVPPMTSADDVSAVGTEDDTLESSNLQPGAKRKSFRRRFSLRKKKSGDKSDSGAKESEEAKQKKKRKNWLLKFLGIRK